MGIFVLVFFLACLFYFLNVLAYIYEITMLLHFMLYAYAVKCKCCVYCVQYIVYLKMHW